MQVMTQKWAVLRWLAVALVLVMGGCDTDSPTAPEPQPSTPPAVSPSTVWNITLTATPSQIEISAPGDFAVRISAVVRRADNNQPPPNGSSLVLSANIAGFDPVAVALRDGAAGVDLAFSASESGTLTVFGSFENSTGQTSVNLIGVGEVAPLFIESVSPDIGSPAGGTRVRIDGTGFSPPVRVDFGGLQAEVVSVTETQVVVRTPRVDDLPVGEIRRVAVTVAINVNLPEGTAADTLPGAFTFARSGTGGGGGGGGTGGGGGGGGALVPRIISVTPTFGPNEGGTEVSVIGEGFDDRVQVFFGTGALIEAQVQNVTESEIKVRTPSATGFNAVNQNSLVDVLVRNVDSGFEDTLVASFQYGSVGQNPVIITAISPSEGPYTGGDIVTLFGAGFEGPVAASLAGVGQDVLSVTGTEVVVRTLRVEILGCQDVSGESAVTNIETGEGGTGPDWIYRVFDPVFSSLNPSSVQTDSRGFPLTPGATTLISGGSFDPPVGVEFGTNAALGVTSVDANTLQVTIPAFTEAFDDEECDDDGDGNVGTRLLPTSVDVVLTNLPSECTVTGGNAFTYIPPSTCVGDAGTDPVVFSISPRSADGAGGTSVTITGVNFESAARVNFGGVPAGSVTFISSTELQVTTPPWQFMIETCDTNGDGQTGEQFVPETVDVEVLNPVAGTTGDFPSSFTFVPVDGSCRNEPFTPLILSISPTTSDEDGGGTITINGQDFTDPVRITVGDATANNAAFISSTQVTGTIPPFTDFDTVACDDNGDGTQGERFIPTAVDVMVENLDSGNSDTFANGFVYDPSPFAGICRNDVGPPPPPPPPSPPVAGFLVTGTAGLTVDFLDTSTGGPTAFQWFFGDGAQSAVRNPSHTYAVPGTYTVTFQVTNADGSDTVQMDVTVP